MPPSIGNNTNANNSQGVSTSNTPNMYNTATNFNSSALPQGGSRIKVAVRIRPMLENERASGHECSRLKVQGSNEIV